METRRRNVSEDRLTINEANKRSKKTSVNEKTENSEDSIPIDLIFEILSRLPAKSVAKCRCVSKLWSSILRSRDFTELFLNRSRARPQLLFVHRKHGKFLFFSSPQPQNPDLNSSSPVVSVDQLMHFRFNDSSCEISGLLHGLVCLIDKRFSKSTGSLKEVVPVICNPSTGQSVPLPKVKTRFGVKSFFGYDPIDKEFKVLSMSSTGYGLNGVFDEHQILTIGGSGKALSWRMIECCVQPHYADDDGICIDGVLYYLACVDKFSPLSMIVCFDLRSEKFRLITIGEHSIKAVSEGKLINYNGKLGSILCNMGDFVDGRYQISGSIIELWVLEDAEKNEWSKRTCVLPSMWQTILGTKYLRVVGMTRANEIVFSTFLHNPFCIVYYNIERNTVVKVGIQGTEAFDDTRVYEFLDHVEDVKLL